MDLAIFSGALGITLLLIAIAFVSVCIISIKGLCFFMHWDDDRETTICALLLTFFLIFVAPVLSLKLLESKFNMCPPGFRVANVIRGADNAKEELADLQRVATDLEKAVADPERIRLTEVGSLLTKTFDFIRVLGERSREQQENIRLLQQEVEDAKSLAAESTRAADAIRSLTREQIEAVKLIITEDAARQSRRAFVIGAVVSFPIGVLASVVASLVFHRYFPRQEISMET